MTIMSEGIARRGKRIVAVQLVASILGATAGYAVSGVPALYGVTGGAAIAIALMLMLRYTMQRASELAVESPQASMNIMYLGAVMRFVMVLGLFAIALGWIRLSATYTVGGFVGVMIAGVLASRGSDSGRPVSKTDLNLD